MRLAEQKGGYGVVAVVVHPFLIFAGPFIQQEHLKVLSTYMLIKKPLFSLNHFISKKQSLCSLHASEKTCMSSACSYKRELKKKTLFLQSSFEKLGSLC